MTDEPTVARRTCNLASFREDALRQFTQALDKVIGESHTNEDTKGKPPLSLEIVLTAAFEGTTTVIAARPKMQFKLPG